MNATTKRFRVALSFPRGQRDYVEKVAKALAQRFDEERVLYDRFHTAEFADADLAFNLPDLYRKESDLIVAVLCGEYVDREWCGLEWRAIYSHIKEGNSKQVMLFRADDAEIRGLHGLEGFAPTDASPDEAVTLILQRLAINEGKRRDFYLEGGQAPAKPAKDWNALSTHLNKLRSESSNAHLLFVEGKRPVVERIRSALDLAGWETSFVPSAFDQYPQGGVGRYYSGIEVKGHNRILAEGVADALLRAGLADVYTTVEPLKMSRENPKWNRLQHRVTIMVGHDKV